MDNLKKEFDELEQEKMQLDKQVADIDDRISDVDKRLVDAEAMKSQQAKDLHTEPVVPLAEGTIDDS